MSKLLKDSYRRLRQQLIQYDDSAWTNGILDKAKIVCQNITFMEYYANVIQGSDPGKLTKWVNSKYLEITNRKEGFVDDDKKMWLFDDAAWMKSYLIRQLESEIHMGYTDKEIARLNRIRLVCENITDEEFREHVLSEKDPDEIWGYVNKKFAEFTGTEVEDYV